MDYRVEHEYSLVVIAGNGDSIGLPDNVQDIVHKNNGHDIVQ
jgi:hypothetical protein